MKYLQLVKMIAVDAEMQTMTVKLRRRWSYSKIASVPGWLTK